MKTGLKTGINLSLSPCFRGEASLKVLSRLLTPPWVIPVFTVVEEAGQTLKVIPWFIGGVWDINDRFIPGVSLPV